MNWEALGAIGELIGAVGVIASLIYVGLQVRQNTRSMRAATYDSLVRSNGEWLAPLIQDAGLAASFEVAVTSWADVQEDQRPRVMYLLTQLFRHMSKSSGFGTPRRKTMNRAGCPRGRTWPGSWSGSSESAAGTARNPKTTLRIPYSPGRDLLRIPY